MKIEAWIERKDVSVGLLEPRQNQSLTFFMRMAPDQRSASPGHSWRALNKARRPEVQQIVLVGRDDTPSSKPLPVSKGSHEGV